MDQSNRNQVIVAESDAAQEENPPPYLKLIADCWEHIFDYLSLKDILVMGQTCKRMHQMAGYYVREYLPEHWFEFIDDEVVTEVLPRSCYLRTDFYQYIRSLCIEDEIYDFLDAELFSSLKTIMFKSIKLSTIETQYTQGVLANVENLHLRFCTIDDADIESIEQMIAYCPKLKYLEMFNCYMSNLVTKSLFAQHFPALEHLNFEQYDTRTDELIVFLEKHPKLKHFKCDFDFLWANRDLLIETNNVQLNILTVVLDSPHIPLDQFVDFLLTLHAREFYKKLHFQCDRELSLFDVENLSNFMSKMPSLEILYVMTDSMIDLSRLTNLKDLRIYFCEISTTDAEIVAKSLLKLERLHIHNANDCDDVRPFICFSKKLKSIKFNLVWNTDYFDLFALNAERKQLDGANRVVIYASEKTYLLSKWKSQNASFSHIEIRRLENYYH